MINIKPKRNEYWLPKKKFKPIEKYNDTRQRNYTFYQSKRWQKLRLIVLAEQPLCYDCKINASEEVHHQHPLSTPLGWSLRFNLYDDDGSLNLIGLCKSCHSKRTKGEQQDIKQQVITDRMNDLNDFD